jgi:hypothetical protein
MPGKTVRKGPIGQRRLRRKSGLPLRGLIRRCIKQIPFKYDESKNSTRSLSENPARSRKQSERNRHIMFYAKRLPGLPS